MDIQRKAPRNSLKPDFSGGLSAARRGSQRLSGIGTEDALTSSAPVSRQISMISETDVEGISGASSRPSFRRMQTDTLKIDSFLPMSGNQRSQINVRVGSASFVQKESAPKVRIKSPVSQHPMLRGMTVEEEDDQSSGDDDEGEHDDIKRLGSLASIRSGIAQSTDDEFENFGESTPTVRGGSINTLQFHGGSEEKLSKDSKKMRGARRADREELPHEDVGDAQQMAMRNARLIKQLIQEAGDEQARCHERWLRRQAGRGEITTKAADKIGIDAKKNVLKLRRKRRVGILSRLKLKRHEGGVGICAAPPCQTAEEQATMEKTTLTSDSPDASSNDSDSDSDDTSPMSSSALALQEEPLDFTSKIEEFFSQRSLSMFWSSEMPAGFFATPAVSADTQAGRRKSETFFNNVESGVLQRRRSSVVFDHTRRRSFSGDLSGPCSAIPGRLEKQQSGDMNLTGGPSLHIPPAAPDDRTYSYEQRDSQKLRDDSGKLSLPTTRKNEHRDSVKFDPLRNRKSQTSIGSISDLDKMDFVVKRISMPEVCISGLSALGDALSIPCGVKRNKLPEIPRLRNRFRDHRRILSGRCDTTVCTLKRSYLEYAEHLGLKEEDWEWMGCIYALDATKLAQAAEVKDQKAHNIAATKLQRQWRALMYYRRAVKRRNERLRAIIKIQRWWRYHATFVLPIKKRVERQPRRLAKLVQLQAHVRGWLARYDLKVKKDLHAVIHRMERLKMELGGQTIEQVVRLQARIRGFLGRLYVKRCRLELEAARLIEEEKRRLQRWQEAPKSYIKMPDDGLAPPIRAHVRLAGRQPTPLPGSPRGHETVSSSSGCDPESPISQDKSTIKVVASQTKACKVSVCNVRARPHRALLDTPLGFRLKRPLNPDVVYMGGLRKGYNIVAPIVKRPKKLDTLKIPIRLGTFLTPPPTPARDDKGDENQTGKVAASLSYAIASKRMQQGIATALKPKPETSYKRTAARLPKVAQLVSWPSGATKHA